MTKSATPPGTLMFVVRWYLSPVIFGLLFLAFGVYGLAHHNPAPENSPFLSPFGVLFPWLHYASIAAGILLVLWAWKKGRELRNGT